MMLAQPPCQQHSSVRRPALLVASDQLLGSSGRVFPYRPTLPPRSRRPCG